MRFPEQKVTVVCYLCQNLVQRTLVMVIRSIQWITMPLMGLILNICAGPLHVFPPAVLLSHALVVHCYDPLCLFPYGAHRADPPLNQTLNPV